MDIRDSAEEARFRESVRGWLQENLPEGWGTPAYREPETAEVGITVAPERRREGLAPRILRAGRATASALGYTLLVARIRADNTVSQRVFEEVGFQLAAEQMFHGTRALRYHWSLSED